MALGGIVTHPQVVTELVCNSGSDAQNADQVVLGETGVRSHFHVISVGRPGGNKSERCPLTTLTPPDRSLEHMDD